MNTLDNEKAQPRKPSHERAGLSERPAMNALADQNAQP
jgi:hypothetical protein